MKPSVTCTDPALNNDTCSCTCTNGIIFNQPVPSPSQNNGGNDASLDTCQAEKDQYMEREREAMDKLNEAEQAHATREKQLLDELTSVRQAHATRERYLLTEANTCWPLTRFKYQGCYFDSNDRLINDLLTNDNTMTMTRCRTICQHYAYFGLEAGKMCFCGNSLRRAGKLAPEAECTSSCVGNANEKCGGHARIGLYSYQRIV